MRRAYVEIVCIQILAEDYFKIEETLDEFASDFGGNPYSFDEYNIANTLKDAILSKDFKTIETLCKKPLFSFLEIEIVRALKKYVMNPPEFKIAPGGDENTKQKVLDNLML